MRGNGGLLAQVSALCAQKPLHSGGLETQLAAITQVLKDDKSKHPLCFDTAAADWKDRIKGIGQLKTFVERATADAKTVGVPFEDLQSELFATVQKPVTAQCLDLRSAVMREATQLLVDFAREYPESF